MFDKDPLTAIEAVTAAQWLAFAPLAFQATAVMRDRGVLAALANAVPAGLAVDEVATRIRPVHLRRACAARSRAGPCTSSGAATSVSSRQARALLLETK